jgi:hypothetical protein
MAEPKKEKKTKKPVRTPALEELPPRAPGALAGSAAGAAAEATDPYLSRNEFKEGFYNQLSKPATSYETLKGTAAKPIPNVTDTESFAEGGSVRGQKNIQVKKKPFRGVF